MTQTLQPQTMTTREILQAAVDREQVHHDIAKAVLALLAKHEGKKLTKRLLPAISQIVGEDVWFGDTYGLQALESASYRRTSGNGGIRFFLGHGTGCPVISAEAFKKHNPGYLDAAADRIRDNITKLASDWPERVDAAAEAVKAAQQAYREVASFGKCSEASAIGKAHGFTGRGGGTSSWLF